MTENIDEDEIVHHKIIQPQQHKAKVVIWSDLTLNHLDVLDDCRTPDQTKSCLTKIFQLEDSSSIKSKILLDLYYYTLQFAKEQTFTKEQTSSFFSIVKKTHEVAVETPFENLQETFNYFKELLLRHAVYRPPFSLGLFTPEQIRALSTYVLETYFRHYKLYKYAFTPQVRLDLSIMYDGIPPTPPPELADELGEAVEDGEQQEGEVEGEGGPDGSSPAPDAATPVEEESEAARQLREMVRTHLTAELKKLKLSIDEQIKAAETTLTDKIAGAEATDSARKKSGKGSAKGKKK